MSILSGARGDSTIDPFGGGSAPVVTVSNPAAGGGASVPTGTAGSPNAAVVTVQGIASGTGLAVSGTVALAAGAAAIGSVSVSNLPATQPVSLASAVVVQGGAAAGSPPVVAPVPVSGVDGGGNKQHLLTDTSGRLTVSDTQSAAFAGVVAITPGTPVTAQRSLGYICTVAGNITLTLTDASTLTLPIQAASGAFQTLPFAVTNVALGTNTVGTFWNLK